MEGIHKYYLKILLECQAIDKIKMRTIRVILLLYD